MESWDNKTTQARDYKSKIISPAAEINASTIINIADDQTLVHPQ